MGHKIASTQVAQVTERIRERSWAERDDYLARMDAATDKVTSRSRLSCTNLAHGFASSEAADKQAHPAAALAEHRHHQFL